MIRNHILFGNHDLNALLAYKMGMEELASREDFHLLGFKNAYLMWNHCLFKLSHEINKYYLRLPEAPYDLALFGHSHPLKFAKNGIYVPPLCDHNLNEVDNFMPGILVGKRIDDILYIVFYSVDELKNTFLSDDKIIEKSKTKSLKMDLKTKQIIQ